jgi:hypothetical protein
MMKRLFTLIALAAALACAGTGYAQDKKADAPGASPAAAAPAATAPAAAPSAATPAPAAAPPAPDKPVLVGADKINSGDSAFKHPGVPSANVLAAGECQAGIKLAQLEIPMNVCAVP